jgi:hypothetical protein
VRAGWQNFKSQLHVHHTVEDDDLWPRLYRAVTDRSRDHAMLKAMESEHAILDPMLDRVDTTLANGDQASLSTDVEALSAALDGHLQHEETSALPLIQTVLTAADWRAFGGRCAGASGSRARRCVSLGSSTAPHEQSATGFFSVLPTPVQMINHVFWEPRYRRLGLWSD